MSHRNQLVMLVMLAAAAAAASLAGCDAGDRPIAGEQAAPSTQPEVEPATTAPRLPPPVEPPDRLRATFLGLAAPKPATWLWRPPQNELRSANYTVPGLSGESAAQLVVFALGEWKPGVKEGNIERWTSQFRTADGGPVDPRIESFEVDGSPATLVELTGQWLKPGAGVFVPDQRLLGVLLEMPGGVIFIRLAGQDTVVDRNRERFLEMVRALRPVEPASPGPETG